MYGVYSFTEAWGISTLGSNKLLGVKKRGRGMKRDCNSCGWNNGDPSFDYEDSGFDNCFPCVWIPKNCLRVEEEIETMGKNRGRVAGRVGIRSQA